MYTKLCIRVGSAVLIYMIGVLILFLLTGEAFKSWIPAVIMIALPYGICVGLLTSKLSDREVRRMLRR